MGKTRRLGMDALTPSLDPTENRTNQDPSLEFRSAPPKCCRRGVNLLFSQLWSDIRNNALMLHKIFNISY